jgi:branched-chain amino acid transport system ATP-binding protein
MSLLEVNGLTKRFGGLVAVNNLDVILDKGEIVALIGPNGAGKTTAFSAIAGFYKPEAGKVMFNGQNITGLRPDQICKLGLVRTFQVVRPFQSLSVLDNIMVGAYARTNDVNMARKKAMETLEYLEMEPMANKVASGLPIADRKRLEIARALATAPHILLLDETMAGLRPTEADEVIKLVQKISASGIAILLVEHVMRVVMSLAGRIIVLHHGEKIAEGTPVEITRNQQVIDAYLGEANVES